MRIIGSKTTSLKNLSGRSEKNLPDSLVLISLNDLQHFSPKEKGLAPDSCLVGINDSTGAKQIVKALSQKKLRHVARNDETLEKQLELTLWLEQNFHESPTILAPIDTLIKKVFLNDQGVQSTSFLFSKSSEKAATIKQIEELTKTIKGTQPLSDSIRLIADELFTNAVFNSPTTYQKPVDRRQSIDLVQQASLTLAHNDESLFIFCQDPFGSLDECEFWAKLVKAYDSEESIQSVNMSQGGAGIGCRMMLDRSSEFYILTQQGHYTLFGFKLPLKKTASFIENLPKIFHIIIHESQGGGHHGAF